MLSLKKERFWYNLSHKLGIEIALYGVGDWVHFPSQTSNSGGRFATDDGEMAPWMMRAIDQKETPWWFHTHPDMPAFLSRGGGEHTDLRGIHELWDMIRKPFRVVVHGHKNQRLEVMIDAKWVRKNPAPPPWVPPPVQQVAPIQAGIYTGRYQSYQTRQPAPMLPASYTPPSYAVAPGLKNEAVYLVQKYGAKSVYEAIDQYVWEMYVDRDPKRLSGHDVWN